MNKRPYFILWLIHQLQKVFWILATLVFWLHSTATISDVGTSNVTYDSIISTAEDSTRTVVSGMSIEIHLTWETSDNLDLILETPSGNMIWRKNKQGFGVSMTHHSNENVYTVNGLIDTTTTIDSIVQPSVETIKWIRNADYERGEYTVHVLFDDRRTCETDSSYSSYTEVRSDVTLDINGNTYSKQLVFDNMLNDRCSDAYLSRYIYTKKSLRPALFTGKAKTVYSFFL